MDILTKLSKRERLILYAVIAFVVCALADRFVIRLIGDRFGQLSGEILLQEKLLGKNIRNLVQEDPVINEYKKFEEYLKPAGSDEEEMAKFLSSIEGFARKSTVYLASIKPRPIMKMDAYKKCVADVESEASMEALINFMYQIESSKNLFKIEKIQLVPKSAESSIIKGYMVVTKILIP
jgi:Tfp pilus assembly protein PilO